MIALLIGSIALGMAAPMITKQVKQNTYTDAQFRVINERMEALEQMLSNLSSDIPLGTIVLWSGKNIPEDWALCNGKNGTPDLRDRFVVGAGNSYKIGNTGGQKEVVLTEKQLPKHKHLMWFNGNYEQNPWGSAKNPYSYYSDRGVLTTAKTLNYNQPVGENKPHENRPPYYALAYIMKIN